MGAMYGRPVWQRVHDPTSELVLTILSQNSADVNAEKAFDALRRRWPSSSASSEAPGDGTGRERINRPGWGGVGIESAAPPDWEAIESAPLAELIDVIRPGGLAPQKAPRIQASLRHVREARGDYSLEPDQMYEAHVNLITHGRRTCTAQRPAHGRCAIAARCRFGDSKATLTGNCTTARVLLT